MIIRAAETADVSGILRLLSQVLEVHAAIRPDLFVSGTTKYSREELSALLTESDRRSYVAVGEDGFLLGYALCILRRPSSTPTMVPHTTLFIDDLCVDESARGQHVGRVRRRTLGQYFGKLWRIARGDKWFYRCLGLKSLPTPHFTN